MASEAVNLLDLVVHELRTPLTVALGSLRQLGVPDSPSQQAALARALRSCERLEQLAADMRAWTHLQKSVPPTGSVALRSALAEATRAAAGRPEVQLVVTQAPDVAVTALPGLIVGALSSLLAAVARAAHPGEVVTLDTESGDGRVTVVMRRTGELPPAPAGAFDAEWLGGLGFSLPLARAIVAAAGGDVRSLQSADGRLASIGVTLAAAPPAPPH